VYLQETSMGYFEQFGYSNETVFIYLYFFLVLINRYLLKDKNDPSRSVNPPNSIEKPEEVILLNIIFI
jgi:hypothetical protein